MNLSHKRVADLAKGDLKHIDKFIKINGGSLFQTSEWLTNIFPSIFPSKNESLLIFDNNNIVALFPLFITNRKVLFQNIAYVSPFYSGGFLLKKDLKDKHLLEVIDYIKGILPRNLIIKFESRVGEEINSFNFFKRGKFQNVHQVVKINEFFLKNCEGRFRTTLKKGIKYNVNCSKDIDIDRLVNLAFETRKTKMSVKIDKRKTKNMYKQLLKSKYSKLFYIIENDELLSFAIILIFGNYAYYAESATVRDKVYNGVNNRLQYEIVLYLEKIGIKIYDLGAYNIENQDEFKKRVYEFKKSMGAKMEFVVEYRWLTNDMLKILNKFI